MRPPMTRRMATRAAAALLATASTHLQPPPHAGEPPQSAALAVVAGGFLIPSMQYQSYADTLERLGCATLLYADESTLSRPRPVTDGAGALLQQAEALASQRGVAPSAPLVLLGHSRGCKTCVVAAAQSRRRVAALVLLDPVDRTDPDPATVLPSLGTLRVPTVLLGSGRSAYDCAPPNSNYERFAESLSAAAPRLVGKLGRAGHTQFVDDRRALSVDVCTPGRVSDAAVREVALATSEAWVRAALLDGAASSEQRARAVACLQETPFEAGVEWSQ